MSGRASNSSLLKFAGSALCFGLRVYSLSSNCIGIASGSGTEIGVASTVNLAVLVFGHHGAPSVHSVAEHGNQYTPQYFSNFAALGSSTHDLRNSQLEPGNIA